jgi:hypothetical protein
VVLRRSHEDLIVGTAERPLGPVHELACVAEAAAAAVRQVAEAGEGAEAVSIQRIERSDVFGEPVVLVSVSAQRQQVSRELLGFCPVEGDAPRAAALAVLNATNRFLGLG